VRLFASTGTLELTQLRVKLLLEGAITSCNLLVTPSSHLLTFENTITWHLAFTPTYSFFTLSMASIATGGETVERHI
jgi:hypothetical protein